jgi:predicted amidophosphoribosyltransferase
MRPGLVSKEQLESMQSYPEPDNDYLCEGCGQELKKCECERCEYEG